MLPASIHKCYINIPSLFAKIPESKQGRQSSFAVTHWLHLMFYNHTHKNFTFCVTLIFNTKSTNVNSWRLSTRICFGK